MKRKPTYRAPRNAGERIAEAKAAIARLEADMQGDNRFGEYGRNCREAIARWQAIIDRETSWQTIIARWQAIIDRETNWQTIIDRETNR